MFILLCSSPSVCPGPAEAPESPLLLPAAARRPGPPQQGAPAEERHVRQAHAQEQTQDKEDGEAGHRPQRLPEMRQRGGGDSSEQDCITRAHKLGNHWNLFLGGG